MDLFYSKKTPTQQLKMLKDELMSKYNITSNVRLTSKDNFKLLYGNKKATDNCVLFILDHVTDKGFLNNKNEKKLIEIVKKYKMLNSLFTYAYPIRTDKITRIQVKEAIPSIELLIDIINPKLIIVLGEITSELFLSRKAIIDDHHGSIITTYNEQPVIQTYKFSYYNSSEGYEDKRYKEAVFKKDWDFITKKYNELINV